MDATFARLGMRIDPRWVTLKFLKSLLFHAKIMLVSSLAHLGLLRSRQRERAEEDQEPHSADQSNNTVLVMDGSTPALVPVHVLASRYKNKVPVLEFGELLAKRRALRGDDGGGCRGGGDQCREKMCAVCLTGIEGRHEVRELLNCSHVFHRECLDRWVEENQVTCPLCRCLLFPAATPRRRIIAEACD
ncbi:probable E3 ubiquitin-protein ligase XERICO [Rhodamnia argentea]|uniref:Probable E3 ubiquitin-protein ligase XERICO n=1 Tax=Rhodamnia argentea TaxID=178133 RepID=A0A8B8NA28_9MYRT|nr:probable E3 ubiquitin-protein ligase XERICO [Rhodamnia argentea]